MEKNDQQFMELNRETAMRLWNKSFGKEAKATDFAGRTIAKGAYNDRNSNFGWNVDHIQPQSKGGVTADHNLVCCHILTNDEKADKFPCFKANGHSFEIVKVQNHYEIRGRDGTPKAERQKDTGVDFYDSADGLRFFKKLKGVQNKARWVGTVWIRIQGVANNAVTEFIEELFCTESISFQEDRLLYSPIWNQDGYGVLMTIRNYDLPFKKDSEALLDKCVLLNTYLSKYFAPCRYILGYEIYYQEDCIDRTAERFNLMKLSTNSFTTLRNMLFVNRNVLEKTRAGNDGCTIGYDGYAEYNYIFTSLANNLEKEANRG